MANTENRGGLET